MPALDALGNGDFTFARKQGHSAHLAQIHADRVVGFFECSGCEIEFDVFAGLEVTFVKLVEGAGRLRAFQHINALTSDGRDEIIEIVGRMHVMRDEIVYLIVSEVAFLFSHVDQFLNVVELVV